MSRTTPIASSIRTAMMLGLGASFLAIPSAALAQQNQDQDEEQAEQDRPERIQVVGSRIRTDGLDNASPIDIITTELATEQGLNTLGELLRTSTVAAGSDQLISAYSVGFVPAGGAGAESVSMRGLGSNRTLVLLNGRRAGPAGTRGQISAFDMNALPISAVERVEIMKDGASSLYGSDAVAGVINIITKRGDESSINISGSAPFDSGGESYRINGTYGQAFNRGSWRVVADYNVVSSGLKRSDRDYFACNTRYFANEFGNRADPTDPRTDDYHCNGVGYGVWTNIGGRIQYDYADHGFDSVGNQIGAVDADGNRLVGPIQDRIDSGALPGDVWLTGPDGFFLAGYDAESDGWLDGMHPFQRNQTMIPETEVASVFLQGDYDLTNNISVYGELMHSHRKTDMRNTRQVFTQDYGQVPISSIDGWSGGEGITAMSVSITDHYSNSTTIDYTRGLIGAEGAIGYWNWDISWQRSLNNGTYGQDIFMRDAMLMSQRVLHGAESCAGQVTEISGRACYDVDWFDPDHMNGNWTQGAQDFLYGYDEGKTIFKQDSVDAYITGDLFELPAGPLSTAIGVAYQTDEIQDTPGEHTRAGNSWGLSGAGITAGRATTKAAYAEVIVPVVQDIPFVESLDLTASGRWTDVSTYGDDTTWKLSANWQIDENWRIRASRGTSFRAPALFELYLDNQTGFLGQSGDPCLNWIESTNPMVRQNCEAAGVPDTYTTATGSTYTSITGGGQGQLQAETSVSQGAGIIFTTVDNRFGFSVDYYDIAISNQVSNVGGASVLSQCYNSENFANEPFCDQITRRTGTESNNWDWGIDEVRGGYLNTSLQQVRGVDYTVTFRESFDAGDLRIKWDHTHQIERTFQQFTDSDPIDYIGRVGNPKHVGTINTSFTRNDWRFTWNINYFDKTSNYHVYLNGNQTTYRGEDVRFFYETPTYVLHAFSANHTFNDNLDITFGIANAFDKQPPMASPAAANVVGNVPLFASQLDYLGRRAFLNAQYSF